MSVVIHYSQLKRSPRKSWDSEGFAASTSRVVSCDPPDAIFDVEAFLKREGHHVLERVQFSGGGGRPTLILNPAPLCALPKTVTLP
jgi:hypothetical protein